MFIVITGDPVDGFSHIGPFKTMEDAIEWAQTHKSTDWWAAPLRSPTEWEWIQSNQEDE